MNGAKMNKPVEGLNRTAKVPVIMQMESLECGAASLAMVLAYYGKWIPLEKVRFDCGVSRDGSKAKNIVLAAKNYGLRVQAFRLEPEELKEDGVFPCIIHWNFNHFVVLNGFKKGRAYLNDPARGACSVTTEEFDHSFTGVCILLEPGEGFEPGGRPASVTDFARSKMRGMRSALAFVVLTIMIASLCSITQAGFSRFFMDELLSGNNPDWLVPFTAGLCIIVLCRITAEWITAIYTLRISGKIASIGNAEYIWKVLHLPMSFFSQRLAGDIQMRMATNAGIAEQLMNTIAPLVLETGMMVFYLILMLRYSALLAMVGIGSIIINFLTSRFISARRVNLTRVLMRDSGKLNSATVSGIDMIETLKAGGAESGFFEKWAGYQAAVNTQQVRFDRLSSYLGLIPAIVSALADVTVVTLGVLLVMRGEFTVGMIFAFQGFLNSFTSPASNLIAAGQTLQEMRTDMERIQDVMSYPEENYTEADPGEGSFAKLGGSLEMRGVSFGYSHLEEPFIKDFNINIKRGERVAIVGSSGCGKSTLSGLISGLYKPWSGEILFDGIPAQDIDRSVFTGSVAVVDQDIILFEDTIANNIKMWDDSIEDFEMILAARDARIHEDIMQREGGYSHRLTEGGSNLSGGQRQRIEIARVLAQDPTIIILDEATSALDAKTEYEVINSIHERGITCVVIAHRLSTVRDCDEIIVMDKGCIAERGTHDELMAIKGLYAELAASE